MSINMPIPVNIENLLSGRIVEWERLEFKKGWNPESILHTICAFANDFNNWGGGYIIIGIEEQNGQPVLPPVGLDQNKIDSIQQELLQLCNRLHPQYFPIVEPIVFDGKNILAIWVPGGSTRPYEAPASLGRNVSYAPYIRRFSSTVRANQQERNDLINVANQIPFDDQINHMTSLDDFSQNLILSYLKKVKSSFADQILSMPFDQFCRQMNIVNGPDEDLHPKNVGLLFFNEEPHRIIGGARIDIVKFEDDSGDSYSEKIFKGPLHQQIYDVLDYLQTNIIQEQVHKVKGEAEAVRFKNYPLEALEEAIVNAIFHKDYRVNNPVEIRIFTNRIEILSYPGPLPPLNKDNLMTGNVPARQYRNRRIGDYLKELRLTEGRGTGFPKIRKTLQENGSPKPLFITDDERSYFQATIPAHPLVDIEAVLNSLTPKNIQTLRYCQKPRSRAEILKEIDLSNHTKNYQNQIVPLIEKGFLVLTKPESPTAPTQKYTLSITGKLLLEQ